MKWDTIAGLPTKGNEFAQMAEKLRECSEHAAMLSHLTRDEDQLIAQGWLGVSEMFKKILHEVTKLATKGLQ